MMNGERPCWKEPLVCRDRGDEVMLPPGGPTAGQPEGADRLLPEMAQSCLAPPTLPLCALQQPAMLQELPSEGSAY